MANTIEIKVPDIGGNSSVPVIEILVQVGDTVTKEQSLITLESDKATMEIPTSVAGVIKEIKLKVGDEVSEGSVIAMVEAASDEAVEATSPNKHEVAKPESAKAEVAKPEPAKVDAPAASNDKPAALAPKAAGESGRKADIDCKLVVLGSGPGGYTAAFRAADLGVDTVLVERYATLGGVCLNVGCIPSKALLHAATVIDEAEAMAAHGITFGKPKIEIDKLRDFKTKVVGKLTGGLTSMAKQRKVRLVEGVGAFISPNELEVHTKDGKKLIRFENAIIAAGSQSVKLPSFPWDDERIIDSTGALELKDVPKKLLVVGGGIIGSNGYKLHAPVAVQVVQRNQVRKFGYAGRAPGCPYIYQS